MKTFFNNFKSKLNYYVTTPLQAYLKTPTGKITFLNSLLFISWNIKGVTESFLVDHFSFERRNVSDYRWYTLFTYAFSHFSTLHFAIDMIALHIAGRQIAERFGGRYVWGLYLAGALAGSIAMNYLMPFDTIPVPKVGADPAISAFISFLIMQNPSATLFHFILPFKSWMLIVCATMFLIVTDSSCKNLGGLAAGVGLGVIKKRLLL